MVFTLKFELRFTHVRSEVRRHHIYATHSAHAEITQFLNNIDLMIAFIYFRDLPLSIKTMFIILQIFKL